MLLVLLPVTAIILLCYTYHCRAKKVTWVTEDVPAVLSIIGVSVFSLVLVVTGIASIVSSCGCHAEEHVAVINSRHIIIAELNSKDPAIHNKGVDEATAYNLAVKSGKEQLENVWTNWLTDRIWRDAEYIEFNIDDYAVTDEVLEEPEVTE